MQFTSPKIKAQQHSKFSKDLDKRVNPSCPENKEVQ